MKTLNKKLTLVTNIILVLTVVFVYGVSFIPDPTLPIYSGEQLNAIYHGNTANKNVSLMFNVYENTEVVNGIIDILNQKGVKATFFVGGCWADDNEPTLNRIVNDGHEIANHGYFHKDHAKLSFEENQKEIERCATIVKALCGVQTTLFAPPSGSFSQITLSVANALDYKVIMWSKDTIDWRDKDEKLIYKRATQNLANGDLVLMHPKPHTKSVLPEIIDFYLQSGFNVVAVSDNV